MAKSVLTMYSSSNRLRSRIYRFLLKAVFGKNKGGGGNTAKKSKKGMRVGNKHGVCRNQRFSIRQSALSHLSKCQRAETVLLWGVVKTSG